MQFRLPANKAEALKALAEFRLIDAVKLIRIEYGLGLAESKHIADALRYGTHSTSDGTVYIDIPSRELDLPNPSFAGAAASYGIVYLTYEGQLKFHPTNDPTEGWQEVIEWGHVPLARLKRLAGVCWIRE